MYGERTRYTCKKITCKLRHAIPWNAIGASFGSQFGSPSPPSSQFGSPRRANVGDGFARRGDPAHPSPEEKIHDAIVENDLVSVTTLLDGGANVSDFKNVLAPACEWGRVEMLQLFDFHGADLLSHDQSSNNTLLHYCAFYGSEFCANFLLSKGIDHKKKNILYKSPLDFCRDNGQHIPAKRGGKFSSTQASEPSPGRKAIEKLILSKMTPEEEKKDDEKKKEEEKQKSGGGGGFSFGGAVAPAAGGFGAPAEGAGGFGEGGNNFGVASQPLYPNEKYKCSWLSSYDPNEDDSDL